MCTPFFKMLIISKDQSFGLDVGVWLRVRHFFDVLFSVQIDQKFILARVYLNLEEKKTAFPAHQYIFYSTNKRFDYLVVFISNDVQTKILHVKRRK